MSWRLKLVAMLLAFTALAMPASALPLCWMHMPAAQKCAPHCPMMAGHDSSVSVIQALDLSSCCRISAAKPTPTTLPQVPTSTFAGVLSQRTASSADVPAEAHAPSPPRDLIPDSPFPGLQAVLCTFLI
jgi:hypothetical protein